ncbi:MAG: DUF4440 domain-containing protein [Candidatus Aminicenantes bacterium]|nr:DUF4440 domain-containing protein [Candidatus Aminicenantes bacterium]
MKKTVLWVLILWIILPLASAGDTRIETEITRILDQQKSSWNEGNLEEFMQSYWKSGEFTFQSGGNRLQGWEALHTRYQNNYSGENMGKLDFSDLVIKVLSDDIVLVLGRWEVATKISTKKGLFTLVIQRTPKGWKIIHDHTSQPS